MTTALQSSGRASRLRILLVALNQSGKGTYWRAFHFGRCLAARGHAITLLVTSPAARLRLRSQRVDGVEVVEMPDLLPGSLRSGWDVWNILRRLIWQSGQSFNIVHAFETRPVVLYPALAAQRRGARLVMDWCDWFGKGGSVEERPNPLVRAALRPVETYFEEHFRARADATTVINTFLRDRAVQLGAPPETVLLLRNGANTTLQPLARGAARRLVGLPDEGPLLGYVGGAYASDAELMARALMRVRRTLPQVRLLLVGYFNRDIEAWLDDPSAVIRTGRVSMEAVYHYLSACDVCWLPLRDSGANRGRWPLKLSDYMTVARPVVATAVGDLAQVVPQLQLGVVTPDDPDEFAAQTLSLLADPARQLRLGLAARQAAETVFDWDRLTGALEAHYRRALSPA